MIEIIDNIGFFLPFYIWILVAYLFYLRPPYIAFYGLFYGIGIWINKIIKQIVREPRPDGTICINGETYEGVESYGMPSGHSQIMGYTTSFLYWVQNNDYIVLFLVLGSLITAYQRWKYRCHTVMQIVVGYSIGIVMGYITYLTTRYWYKNWKHETRLDGIDDGVE